MMKGSMSTELGIITISPEVIAKYAGSVAVECFGIVGMAAVNMKDGLVRLLKRESLTHGIHVDISDDNILVLDFHVIVAYGVNILSVSDNQFLFPFEWKNFEANFQAENSVKYADNKTLPPFHSLK